MSILKYSKRNQCDQIGLSLKGLEATSNLADVVGRPGRYILKMALFEGKLFWQLFENIGLLFIPPSGHTTNRIKFLSGIFCNFEEFLKGKEEQEKFI